MQQLLRTNRDLEAQINTTKEAQFKARTNQKLFASIAHNFPRGLIMVVDENQKILHLEGEEVGLLHLDNWDFKNQPVIKLPGLTVRHRDLLKHHILETLNGAHHSFELEFLSQAYTINSTPLSIDHQPCWALLVWSNTTDKKKHEQELVRALEAQQELNDLKSRFMSMASHEFRTPLSAILTSATLIGKQQEPEKEDRRNRYVAQIQNNVRNLVVILDDFLSLSKLDEGEITCNPTSFDLRFLLRTVLEEMEANLKIGQHFLEDCEPGSYRIHQDPKLTRHILLNLLSNAIKYAPENSVIELTMRREDGNIMLSVRDHGIGIPKKEQKQIFNRFFRARNVENIQGTGLGLNIVKQYIELMGGQIHFQSTEGKGSTFEISIPITHHTYGNEKDFNH
jgi:signal transduction histidine kinase